MAGDCGVDPEGALTRRLTEPTSPGERGYFR